MNTEDVIDFIQCNEDLMNDYILTMVYNFLKANIDEINDELCN